MSSQSPALEIESLCLDMRDIAHMIIGHIEGDMLVIEERHDEHGSSRELVPIEQWPEPYAALWAIREAAAAVERAQAHLAKLIKAERDELDRYGDMADAQSY